MLNSGKKLSIETKDASVLCGPLSGTCSDNRLLVSSKKDDKVIVRLLQSLNAKPGKEPNYVLLQKRLLFELY